MSGVGHQDSDSLPPHLRLDPPPRPGDITCLKPYAENCRILDLTGCTRLTGEFVCECAYMSALGSSEHPFELFYCNRQSGRRPTPIQGSPCAVCEISGRWRRCGQNVLGIAGDGNQRYDSRIWWPTLLTLCLIYLTKPPRRASIHGSTR